MIRILLGYLGAMAFLLSFPVFYSLFAYKESYISMGVYLEQWGNFVSTHYMILSPILSVSFHRLYEFYLLFLTSHSLLLFFAGAINPNSKLFMICSSLFFPHLRGRECLCYCWVTHMKMTTQRIICISCIPICLFECWIYVPHFEKIMISN